MKNLVLAKKPKRTRVRLRNYYNRGQKVLETDICPFTPSPRQACGLTLLLPRIKHIMRGIALTGQIIRGILQLSAHKEIAIVFVQEGGNYRA